jgi:hypothetical protein
MAYNPSSIRINRMLGATRPIRPPKLPTPQANPKLGSSLNLRQMMRPAFAIGGSITDSPDQPFTGGILSSGAGRADDVQMHVPNGAYVVPAWGVSHLGEGNTVNGMQQLKMMFGSPWQAPKTPFGAPSPPLKGGKGMPIPKPPGLAPFGWAQKPPSFAPAGMSQENPALQEKQAHGGAARGDNGGAVPINASGGEFVIDPAEVARIGDGNVNKGHLILDKWIVALKKEAANTIAKLPGPAK